MFTTATGFAQEVTIGSHKLYTDEPVSYGGTDTGPSLMIFAGRARLVHVDDNAFMHEKRTGPLEKITFRCGTQITRSIARMRDERRERSIGSSSIFS